MTFDPNILLNRLFSVLVIFSILLPDLVKVGILIDFALRQDYIAEALCIRKEEPMNLCNGKCYLAQQLEKAREEQRQDVPLPLNERLEILFCQEAHHYVSSTVEILCAQPGPTGYGEAGVPARFAVEIFRPPEVHLI